MGRKLIDNKILIAHYKDGSIHSIADHLKEVAELSKGYSRKFDLPLSGELIGLLHDLGKYSEEFQRYISSASGLIDQDMDEEAMDHVEMKGKIDHSTAGAQWVAKEMEKYGIQGRVVAQFLSMCIASHHSGLIDCIGPDGTDVFRKRSIKSDDRTHLNESISKVDNDIISRALALANGDELRGELLDAIKRVSKGYEGGTKSFNWGLLLRFLFSCLIDADRKNTSEFGYPLLKTLDASISWDELIDRIEKHISSIKGDGKIDHLRREVSKNCLDAADRNRGTFTLTVPTGGGKNISSLRFALHHAKKHDMERIIHVVPYTSIIDQNAQVARDILEQGKKRFIVEHHSNLTPEKDTWKNRSLSENWDAPIIYTTMAQFLESLFSSGTRDVRRLHRLSKSVIVFDEIQSLPMKTMHLFCNALNFIVHNCGSTALLCTATQPLLHELDHVRGTLKLDKHHEIVPDVDKLFTNLKRVKVFDKRRPNKNGWSTDDLALFSIKSMNNHGSCLAIMNTKAMALTLYEKCKNLSEGNVFHLSTNMCPAHRKEVLKQVRHRLSEKDGEPILCISTQLIEAGVDIDFGCVIRSWAGLDSIAQAAGRCNRHGKHGWRPVYIVDPRDENVGKLKEIFIGQQCLDRLLREYDRKPSYFNDDILGDKAIKLYFRYYFSEMKHIMSYPVGPPQMDRSDTILEMLSDNRMSCAETTKNKQALPDLLLRQSFMSASKMFKSIDSASRGVIVPYNERAIAIIDALRLEEDPNRSFKLIRESQQYSINLFQNVFEILFSSGALQEINKSDIFTLRKEYYDDRTGLVAIQ